MSAFCVGFWHGAFMYTVNDIWVTDHPLSHTMFSFSLTFTESNHTWGSTQPTSEEACRPLMHVNDPDQRMLHPLTHHCRFCMWGMFLLRFRSTNPHIYWTETDVRNKASGGCIFSTCRPSASRPLVNTLLFSSGAVGQFFRCCLLFASTYFTCPITRSSQILSTAAKLKVRTCFECVRLCIGVGSIQGFRMDRMKYSWFLHQHCCYVHWILLIWLR